MISNQRVERCNWTVWFQWRKVNCVELTPTSVEGRGQRSPNSREISKWLAVDDGGDDDEDEKRALRSPCCRCAVQQVKGRSSFSTFFRVFSLFIHSFVAFYSFRSILWLTIRFFILLFQLNRLILIYCDYLIEFSLLDHLNDYIILIELNFINWLWFIIIIFIILLFMWLY